MAVPRSHRHHLLDKDIVEPASQELLHLSGHAAEQAMTCIVAGFLNDAGIDFDPAALASACPSERTLREIVIDGSVDTILWLEEQLLEASAIPFFLVMKATERELAISPRWLAGGAKKKIESRQHALTLMALVANQKSVLRPFVNLLKKFVEQFPAFLDKQQTVEVEAHCTVWQGIQRTKV